MCILRNTHAHSFVNIAKKNSKIKRDPLEKAKLFTRFSEMKLLRLFVFSLYIITGVRNLHTPKKFSVLYLTIGAHRPWYDLLCLMKDYVIHWNQWIGEAQLPTIM